MASLERIVDILNGEILPETARYVLSAVSSGDLLKDAPDGAKHKLKVKISSMLKSSGLERALGAHLARAAISVDWSVIRSHGGSWAGILIHVLDLPDAVCWGPAIQFMSALTTLIHGKQELIREVTNAKVSDFIKRLVVMLEKCPEHALEAFAVLLQLYPGACRAYASKVRDRAMHYLTTRHWRIACKVLSALCWVEKSPAAAWREAVLDVLSNLSILLTKEEKGKYFAATSFKSASELKLWHLLSLFIGGPKPANVKLPASKLADLLDRSFRSLDPDTLECIYTFFVDSKVYNNLESLYIRQFDMLLHHFVEAVQLNRTMALKYGRCAGLLIGSIWVPKKYNVTISRLVKYVLAAAADSTPIGVEGLSDYVSHPDAFQRVSAEELIEHTSELLQAIILNVNGLNNSTRSEIDSYFISTGRKGLNTAALYPGKYSILPIALNVGVEGLECLIHPRFPPLAGQSATIEKDEDNDDEPVPTTKMIIEPITIASKELPSPILDTKMPEFIPETQPTLTRSPINTPGHPVPTSQSPGHDHTLDEIISPHFEPVVEPDFPVPEPSKPQPEPIKSPTPKRVDSLPQPRPEKRPRVDDANTAVEADNDDDDDDFVMPTLQMDSD
ncbi:hypothetical protein B9G98_02503 [Wickerhamiella sorbophila]|uniref:Pre-rRNA-processing protein RIX1 n=1 Tax=Wickerhamiella sorbophila TaxID=45607 RepID=A0A2T0FIQ6_9ASCO|nr:hypothetical protein B9G98_02503 [Wickerhamiella sorbophila]PRT54883.1 hypothetical protein B9G98_02503 [Wickerhamiella sorbophila]